MGTTWCSRRRREKCFHTRLADHPFLLSPPAAALLAYLLVFLLLAFTMNDALDYVGSRMWFMAAIGGLAGTGLALLRGHPVARTAGHTALSCALSTTAVSGSERLAYAALGHLDIERWDRKLTSHFMGGTLGGSVLGALYIGKPIRGLFFFAPLMTIVGFGELLWEDVRLERQREALLKEEDERAARLEQ